MATMLENKSAVVNRLKQDILRLQGFAPSENPTGKIGLGPIESVFPNGVFPAWGIHEFISTSPEQEAAASGFIGGILARLMEGGKVCLWISNSKVLFPPAIRAFGVEPDRIVFVDMARQRDVLWAMEEGLKCPGLAAVVAEVRELEFVQSRRLQLAVEKSRIMGFVLRSNPRKIGATASVARWQIRHLASALEEGLPGVGFPRWEVELMKVRNGHPGYWKIEWSSGNFIPVDLPMQPGVLSLYDRKSG
ncbi:ImuA family protein [Parapedobacter deserti]|uniref:ImuA family protein n=1 Tax=Parapedobacter deserti TaxID=1912957 RepID=A0ABV7JP94_9SPHI